MKVKLTLVCTIEYTPNPNHYPDHDSDDLLGMGELDAKNFQDEPMSFFEQVEEINVKCTAEVIE